jgi:phosphoglycerate dehydrogenase-like enzyme
MHISIWLNQPDIIAYSINEKQKSKLKKELPNCTVSLHENSNSFKDDLKNADIAIAWVFNQSWFKIASKLKWIATPTAGRDFFSVDPPQGITVTFSAFHGKIIAETVLGAMLGFSRGLFFACKNHNTLFWPKKEISLNLSTLRGSHLVILGFGNIGSWIAKVAKPFGVRITGVKRQVIEKPDYLDEEDKIILIENLDSILPHTDHLVIALPRDESTNNILDKRRLELLPNNCYIYNIGRGNAIDEDALANALKTGKIRGAYLDVFKNEPLIKNSPLRDCPNIIWTPHSSAIAPMFLDHFIEEFITRYKQWIKNQV